MPSTFMDALGSMASRYAPGGVYSLVTEMERAQRAAIDAIRRKDAQLSLLRLYALRVATDRLIVRIAEDKGYTEEQLQAIRAICKGGD